MTTTNSPVMCRTCGIDAEPGSDQCFLCSAGLPPAPVKPAKAAAPKPRSAYRPPAAAGGRPAPPAANRGGNLPQAMGVPACQECGGKVKVKEDGTHYRTCYKCYKAIIDAGDYVMCQCGREKFDRNRFQRCRQCQNEIMESGNWQYCVCKAGGRYDADKYDACYTCRNADAVWEACPSCGKRFNNAKGYGQCYTCSQKPDSVETTCPGCGRRKKAEFDLCYDCYEAGG